MLGGKIGKRFHHLGIQRSDDHVTLSSLGVTEKSIDIRIFRHVPCTDIRRDIVGTQRVTRHQDTAIVLQHALAVTIDLMKGQHDTHPDGTLTHIDIRRLRGSDGLLAACRRLIVLRSLRLTLWPWDIDIVSFLQFITWRVHLRVGSNQFLNSDAIHTGDSEDGLLPLYLMLLTELRLLGESCLRGKNQQERQCHIS